MNYLLPMQDIMSMHCSANVGEKGDVALFFGLSGTQKPYRLTHTCNESVMMNTDGIKTGSLISKVAAMQVTNLSKEKEPQIFDAIKYGAILENTVVAEDGSVDFEDNRYTENTRAAYPVKSASQDNIVVPSKQHIQQIYLMVIICVIPPISKLNKDQAMYHFLSGFTSKWL